MELITREINAKHVADNWYESYHDGEYWTDGTDKQGIHKKLVELAPNTNPDDVNEIIGNTSWIDTQCNECENKNIPLVIIGEELDRESFTAFICLSCIEKAINLLKNNLNKT